MKIHFSILLFLTSLSPVMGANILIGNILINAPTSLATLTIANPMDASYNTGLNCYNKTILSSPLIEFNVATMTIGNYSKKTSIFLPSLPVSQDPPTQLQYLMTTRGNNNMIYIGVDDSPNPAPDFYIIPNLKVNDVWGNYTDLLINVLGGGTIIGNATNTTTVVANQLNISNTNEEIQTKRLSSDQYLLTFSSPVTFGNNVTVNNNDIIINGDMNFTGKNPFLVDTVSFTHSLTINNQVQFGRNENDSVVNIEGPFQANGDVYLGTSGLPIKKITNIPILSNITPENYFYLLVNKTTNKLTKGPQKNTIIITEDIIHESSINSECINATNSADTIFQASNIQCNYTNSVFSGNFSLSNSPLLGTIIFDNCLFDQAISVILSGNTGCNITGNAILLVDSYHRKLYGCGKITLPFTPLPIAPSIKQGLINKKTGLLCQLGSNTSDFYQAKQNIKSIQETISKYEEKIDHYKGKMQEIKTIITFLLALSKKEILQKMKLRHALRGTIL
jgi:hypothetical protein